MKAVLFSLILLSSYTGYAQLSVASTLTENKYQSHLYPTVYEDVSQDLFFSIGPNGLPQYGQNVSWNLEENTTGTARFYHVKKGDWDRSAVRSISENVNYIESPNPFPVDDNLNVNMEENWIKFGTSWNFSHDNYNIAIISFTNQKDKPMDTGTIKFSHPNHPFISLPEIIIYNKWVEFVDDSEDSGIISYEFKFDNLQPGEIRYLYLKVDISQKTSFFIQPSQFTVEMVGYQSESIIADGIVPPHDPNALTLMTALENTPPIYNCDQYDHIPDLDEVCKRDQLFWVLCREPGSPKCPKKWSLHYPYCNIDSEELSYRITCLNDGAGIAKHVKMDAKFDIYTSPFNANVFHYESSHPASGFFKYPDVKFSMDEIYLPGLEDENFVYTYDECSAEVIFQLKTLCNIKEKFKAIAAITFYDLNDEPVEEVITNEVYAVPEQGVYNNYTPECISCNEAKTSISNMEESTLSWANSTLNISMKRKDEAAAVNVRIFDTAGRIIKSLDIQPNGSSFLNEHINTLNIPSGIYFVSIQNGKERFVKKFIIP